MVFFRPRIIFPGIRLYYRLGGYWLHVQQKTQQKISRYRGLTFQIAHVKQSQRGRSGQIYWNQVRDLKPNFLSPQWSEMKNLGAYHQEDFLRNLKLILILILVPLLRELWPFKHRSVFLGHPVHFFFLCICNIFPFFCSGVYLPTSEFSAGRMVFTHTGARSRLYLFVNPETGVWEVSLTILWFYE